MAKVNAKARVMAKGQRKEGLATEKVSNAVPGMVRERRNVVRAMASVPKKDPVMGMLPARVNRGAV